MVLKNWADSAVGVYLDFGDQIFTDDRFNFSKPVLWKLLPVDPISHVELIPIWRKDFVDAAQNGSSINGINDPDMVTTDIPKRIEASQKHHRRKSESDLEYSLRVYGLDKIF
jgi:hypothetical protein